MIKAPKHIGMKIHPKRVTSGAASEYLFAPKRTLITRSDDKESMMATNNAETNNRRRALSNVYRIFVKSFITVACVTGGPITAENTAGRKMSAERTLSPAPKADTSFDVDNLSSNSGSA